MMETPERLVARRKQFLCRPLITSLGCIQISNRVLTNPSYSSWDITVQRYVEGLEIQWVDFNYNDVGYSDIYIYSVRPCCILVFDAPLNNVILSVICMVVYIFHCR